MNLHYKDHDLKILDNLVVLINLFYISDQVLFKSYGLTDPMLSTIVQLIYIYICINVLYGFVS